MELSIFGVFLSIALYGSDYESIAWDTFVCPNLK